MGENFRYSERDLRRFRAYRVCRLQSCIDSDTWGNRATDRRREALRSSPARRRSRREGGLIHSDAGRANLPLCSIGSRRSQHLAVVNRSRRKRRGRRPPPPPRGSPGGRLSRPPRGTVTRAAGRPGSGDAERGERKYGAPTGSRGRSESVGLAPLYNLCLLSNETILLSYCTYDGV